MEDGSNQVLERVEENGLVDISTNNADEIKLRNSDLIPTPKERVVDKRSLADCELYSVTVFLDKAEVCRLVPVNLTADQSVELVFGNISPAINKDSIRIEARNAPVTIQDVSLKTLSQSIDCSVLDGEIRRLEEQQKQSYRQKESLIARQKRLSKQRAVLERFADVLVRNSDATAHNISNDINDDQDNTLAKPSFTEAFNPKHMETLNGFFEMYEKQAEKLDEQILTSNEEMEAINKEISSSVRRRLELEEQKEKVKGRELSIYLEAREVVRSQIAVCYIVNQSSWRPTYDIRIINNESKMKITYYAIINQHTAEEWKDVQELFVSTVQPPIGGSVPDMGVQKVFFKSSSDSKSLQSPQMKLKSRKSTKGKSTNQQQVAQTLMDSSIYVSEQEAIQKEVLSQSSQNKPIMPNYSTNINTSNDTPCALYKVPRPPSLIESTIKNSITNNDQNKVVIGYIDLQPNFEYSSVPKRAPYAYLKANAINSTNFVILQGEANVFIDQNYIGKSELRTVAPGESFTCHIGADHRIQIAYHPMFKYREGGAPITKTTCLTFKQLIEVTNSHPKPIKMTLMDQLPVANEDKIKVSLQEPSIKHAEKYDKSKPIRLYKSSQVEWDLDIGSCEKKEITLKYTVEYPAGECLDLITE